ncbi:MAG: hypothetical protein OXF84_12035 [Bacteroidetes bacterium]|nr:hypothetical protein [Bacteroidota bacterium]
MGHQVIGHNMAICSSVMQTARYLASVRKSPFFDGLKICLLLLDSKGFLAVTNLEKGIHDLRGNGLHPQFS